MSLINEQEIKYLQPYGCPWQCPLIMCVMMANIYKLKIIYFIYLIFDLNIVNKLTHTLGI